jgi:hypothetical protein
VYNQWHPSFEHCCTSSTPSFTTGDWLVLVGDLIVLATLFVTYLIYLRQASASDERDIDSVLGMLRAVRSGIEPWGKEYFRRGYDDDAAAKQSERDADLVRTNNYYQVFSVPTEPLAAIIEHPEEGWLIDTDTIEAANIALWRLRVFNQLVQQQTDFNAYYLPEIYDGTLSQPRREALAAAAGQISRMIHGRGIGDASWYRDLMDSLDRNIERLVHKKEHLPTRTFFHPAGR